MNEASIQTAMNATAIFMQNKEDRLKYLNREMAIIDYESDKVAWINEGVEKGRNDTIRALLASGISFDVIQKATGMTAEQLEALAKK